MISYFKVYGDTCTYASWGLIYWDVDTQGDIYPERSTYVQYIHTQRYKYITYPYMEQPTHKSDLVDRFYRSNVEPIL